MPMFASGAADFAASLVEAAKRSITIYEKP